MVKKTFFVLILAVFIIEAMLQLISFVVGARGSYLLRKQFNSALNGNNVIMCIGDSYVFGTGVTNCSFPVQLEGMLHEKLGNNFKVVNLGVPGSNSAQIFMRLQENFQKYNPIAVIVLAGGGNESNFLGIPIYNWTDRLDPFFSRLKTYKLIRISVTYFKKAMNRDESSNLTKARNPFSKKYIRRTEAVIRMEQEMSQYYQKGDYARANECALNILRIDPNSFNAHFYLSRRYSFKSQNVELAKKEGLLALQCAGDFAESLHVLPYLRALAKNKDECIEWIKPILKENVGCDDIEKIEQYIRIAIDDERSFRVNAVKKDLRKIIKYIRIRGAMPILLTYPQYATDFTVGVNNAIRSVATENKVIIVDIGKTFFEIKDNDLRQFNKLFMLDGHCTEYGYKIIAQELYRRIAAFLHNSNYSKPL